MFIIAYRSQLDSLYKLVVQVNDDDNLCNLLEGRHGVPGRHPLYIQPSNASPLLRLHDRPVFLGAEVISRPVTAGRRDETCA